MNCFVELQMRHLVISPSNDTNVVKENVKIQEKERINEKEKEALAGHYKEHVWQGAN